MCECHTSAGKNRSQEHRGRIRGQEQKAGGVTRDAMKKDDWGQAGSTTGNQAGQERWKVLHEDEDSPLSLIDRFPFKS